MALRHRPTLRSVSLATRMIVASLVLALLIAAAHAATAHAAVPITRSPTRCAGTSPPCPVPGRTSAIAARSPQTDWAATTTPRGA